VLPLDPLLRAVERELRFDDPRANADDGDSDTGPSIVSMTAHEKEVARQMHICNACRYCEGYCAVFPAMTRRLQFIKADVNYLANLCHNCGACYHACQYAPPHEFAVNVPRAMAKVRVETYAEYAWPRAFGALYRRNGTTVVVALAVGQAIFLALAIGQPGPASGKLPEANFYAIFPHQLMATVFGAEFAWVVIALAVGVRRFWRDVSEGAVDADALAEATKDALALSYLGGGHGEGCNEADDRFTLARRRFHHLTFYGFLLCFASTCVATLYHYLLRLEAPYQLTSAPVILGSLGGLCLIVGPLGLWRLNVTRDPNAGDLNQRPMDRGFMLLLVLTSGTGLALLVWRDTVAMPLLLAVHLGVVSALFATLPYGKFAHGIYRSASLLKWAGERRRPGQLTTGSE
jgi:citrate/tricarballylate utilization protein